MSQLNKLYIATAGMITPIGMDSAMTAASVKAGVSAYQTSDYINKSSQPMTTAWVPDDALPELEDDLVELGLGADEKRMIQLSSVALEEVSPWFPENSPLTLLLAGPENIPARPKPIEPTVIRHIQTQSGIEFDLATSRYLPQGRAGVIQAIKLAFDYFAKTDKNYILVGGVDTFCNTGLISYLDSENRILASNIADGFAPGEAAGFLLLSRQPHKSFLPVFLSRPGLSDEPGHRYADQPYMGDGLANAVNDAIQNSDGRKISQIYSSMNGESFFVKELGVASIRNSDSFTNDYRVSHPADCYGDLGAATGAVLIALSAQMLKENSEKNNTAAVGFQHLTYCSSDLSARAAICVNGIT